MANQVQTLAKSVCISLKQIALWNTWFHLFSQLWLNNRAVGDLWPYKAVWLCTEGLEVQKNWHVIRTNEIPQSYSVRLWYFIHRESAGIKKEKTTEAKYSKTNKLGDQSSFSSEAGKSILTWNGKRLRYLMELMFHWKLFWVLLN